MSKTTKVAAVCTRADHVARATITVNVISTFLLAHLLLPKLQQTAVQFSTTPRLTIVSSKLHKFATLKARSSPDVFQALKQPLPAKECNDRYMDSKLLVVLCVQKMAASMLKSGDGKVCLTAACPGYCHSALKPPVTFGERMGERMMARSTDEGARILVDAIAADKVEGRQGKYLGDMRVERYDNAVPRLFCERTLIVM